MFFFPQLCQICCSLLTHFVSLFGPPSYKRRSGGIRQKIATANINKVNSYGRLPKIVQNLDVEARSNSWTLPSTLMFLVELGRGNKNLLARGTLRKMNYSGWWNKTLWCRKVFLHLFLIPDVSDGDAVRRHEIQWHSSSPSLAATWGFTFTGCMCFTKFKESDWRVARDSVPWWESTDSQCPLASKNALQGKVGVGICTGCFKETKCFEDSPGTKESKS